MVGLIDGLSGYGPGTAGYDPGTAGKGPDGNGIEFGGYVAGTGLLADGLYIGIDGKNGSIGLNEGLPKLDSAPSEFGTILSELNVYGSMVTGASVVGVGTVVSCSGSGF